MNGTLASAPRRRTSGPRATAVGESLAVGAMIANPVAGAVVWAAQKIFRDPLDQAFAFEYAVTGSWARPQGRKAEAQKATEENK